MLTRSLLQQPRLIMPNQRQHDINQTTASFAKRNRCESGTIQDSDYHDYHGIRDYTGTRENSAVRESRQRSDD